MRPMEWVTQVHFSVNAGDSEEVENKGGKEDPGAIYVAHPGLFIEMSAYWTQNYIYKMQKLKIKSRPEVFHFWIIHKNILNIVFTFHWFFAL